jgi:hypothetical protein
MILTFLACAQTIRTPDGEERVRSALWIEGPRAGQPDEAFAIVANTPIPCRPEQVADDSNTPTDETAGAQEWWEAQLGTAITREGAVLFLIFLREGGTLDSVNVGPVSNPEGWGLGYRVVEAELQGRDGPYFYYSPTTVNWDARSEGTVELDRNDEFVSINANVGEWIVDVAAERCDNPALVTAIYDFAGSLSAAQLRGG